MLLAIVPPPSPSGVTPLRAVGPLRLFACIWPPPPLGSGPCVWLNPARANKAVVGLQFTYSVFCGLTFATCYALGLFCRIQPGPMRLPLNYSARTSPSGAPEPFVG